MTSEKEVKTSKVFQYIFQGIKTGRYTSGQTITESEIVNELGVSRTPVREGLRRLEKFGLIEWEPHKGIRIISMTKERVEHLYQVREVLEGLGARLIAQRKNEEAVQNLRKILEKAEIEVEKGNIDELSKINSDFHLEIANASENTYLINVLNTLQSHIQLVMVTSLSNENRPPENLKEHKMIVDCIETWEPEVAEAIMKSHLRKAYQQALHQLNS